MYRYWNVSILEQNIDLININIAFSSINPLSERFEKMFIFMEDFAWGGF